MPDLAKGYAAEWSHMPLSYPLDILARQTTQHTPCLGAKVVLGRVSEPFPPVVADGLLFSALTAAIEGPMIAL